MAGQVTQREIRLRFTSFIVAAFLGLSLAACGGGGGGGTATTPQPPTTPSNPSTPGGGTSTSLQTSVPAATYATTSAEASAYKILNQERLRCGVGLLAQNSSLDTAAAGQTNYQVLRQLEGTFGSHNQTAGLSGYVATTPADRVAIAGYKGTYIGEDIAYAKPDQANDLTGENLVRSLLATVYHQSSVLDGFRDVGVSVGFPDKAPAATRFPVLTLNLGYLSSQGAQEPTDVVTYPCEGSTGVQPAMIGESPDPFTGLGFAAGPTVGHPILVRAPTGKVIKLTSASLTAGAKIVPSVLYHVSDDKNNLLKPHQAFVIPREGLAVSTTYQVNVTGTVDGAAFSRSFSFTTRSTQ